MTRDEIIARLAAVFGPHRAYDAARCAMVLDGNDADATATTMFQADDGMLSFRSLTYGEIADALAGDPELPAGPAAREDGR